jgi:DNA-binding NarL/FixJ family response regulator
MITTLAPTTRVLIINDDSFELATLAASLRQHCINVVGEAANSYIAENLFRALSPDVVLVDLQESGEASVRLLQKMRKAHPDLGIVITTSCPDLRIFGLLEKNIPTGSQIVLKRNFTDISIITLAIAESLIAANEGSQMKWVNFHASDVDRSLTSVLGQLTNIQVETLRLVAHGLSNSEIAKVRFVSEKSVEQIVARIAQHLSISPDRRRNLRVMLVGEYFKWLGAPKH